jgi:hypothetical protein
METGSCAHWTERVGDWFDERFDVRIPLEAFLKKPVPKHAIRWYFCLGGITFALFLIQGATGILLSLYYKPTPEAAYESILFIMNSVRFGWLIRSIHSWSASLMIATCVAHMLRVYITGAYKRPRELNWVAGVFLLLLTLGSEGAVGLDGGQRDRGCGSAHRGDVAGPATWRRRDHRPDADALLRDPHAGFASSPPFLPGGALCDHPPPGHLRPTVGRHLSCGGYRRARRKREGSPVRRWVPLPLQASRISRGRHPSLLP